MPKIILLFLLLFGLVSGIMYSLGKINKTNLLPLLKVIGWVLLVSAIVGFIVGLIVSIF